MCGVGFRVEGTVRASACGARPQAPAFGVQGSGFRVQGSGFRVQGLGGGGHRGTSLIRNSIHELQGYLLLGEGLDEDRRKEVEEEPRADRDQQVEVYHRQRPLKRLGRGVSKVDRATTFDFVVEVYHRQRPLQFSI